MADLVVTKWCGETHYAVDFCEKVNCLNPKLSTEIARYPLTEAEAGCSLGILIAAARTKVLTAQRGGHV